MIRGKPEAGFLRLTLIYLFIYLFVNDNLDRDPLGKNPCSLVDKLQNYFSLSVLQFR